MVNTYFLKKVADKNKYLVYLEAWRNRYRRRLLIFPSYNVMCRFESYCLRHLALYIYYMKNTLVVNLLGGPGVGKSTTSAWIFALLKQKGIDCELVSEFAKDLVWENRKETLNDQIYLFGKQQHRIARLKGKVDVIITDSPLILNIIYGEENPELHALVISEFKKYNNLNFFLIRKKKYNPNGRNQTEDEAKLIDDDVRKVFEKYQLPYEEIEGDEEAPNKILERILKLI